MRLSLDGPRGALRTRSSLAGRKSRTSGIIRRLASSASGSVRLHEAAERVLSKPGVPADASVVGCARTARQRSSGPLLRAPRSSGRRGDRTRPMPCTFRVGELHAGDRAPPDPLVGFGPVRFEEVQQRPLQGGRSTVGGSRPSASALIHRVQHLSIDVELRLGRGRVASHPHRTGPLVASGSHGNSLSGHAALAVDTGRGSAASKDRRRPRAGATRARRGPPPGIRCAPATAA